MARKAAAPKHEEVKKGSKVSKVAKGKVTKELTPRQVKKNRRMKKDKNAPKRALSAYMFFSQAKRQSVKDSNADVSFGQIGKILGTMWAQMDDVDKEPYQKQAEKDKLRYEAEKAAYTGSAGAKEDDYDEVEEESE
ncbi:Non-histone chromosomal protein 6 [Coemansia sp. Benny D115]|nr:Non-histone chromosomal protein 6 [Coemansia sp. Benny D115]